MGLDTLVKCLMQPKFEALMPFEGSSEIKDQRIKLLANTLSRLEYEGIYKKIIRAATINPTSSCSPSLREEDSKNWEVIRTAINIILKPKVDPQPNPVELVGASSVTVKNFGKDDGDNDDDDEAIYGASLTLLLPDVTDITVRNFGDDTIDDEIMYGTSAIRAKDGAGSICTRCTIL